MFLFPPAAMDNEDQTQLQPFVYELANLEGVPAHVGIGQGRITFLSYWATWCPPCRAELPSIQELYKDYGDKVDFVLITHEDPKDIQTFIEKKQFDLPVYLPRMKTPTALMERTIPTNYVLDKNGKVIVKEQGATDWNSEKMRSILDTLLVQ